MVGASGVGASKFRLSSDKEKVMTPHIVMSSVYDLLDKRPSLRSGLNDLIRFLISDLSVSSDDNESVEFMNEWLQQRSDFDTQVQNFAFSLIGCGTGYMQPYYNTKTNNSSIFNTVKAVPDSSIIYRNLEAEDKDDDYWLMEVPIEVQEFDGIKSQYRPFWYIKGSRFYYKYIWCIPYPKKAYDHCVYGHSRNLPWYGWGTLNSAVDNVDIQEEILKNWALQAKYRALGKKILGFYNSSDDPVSLQELEDIREEFSTLEEEESLIVNKRFDQVDLSFSGQDTDMQPQLEWLHKDSGSSLVPNYMTAFSQDSSMATAAEAKIPFSLELKSIQPVIVDFLNKIIIDRLREEHSFLADDLSFELGQPELYSRDEVFNMIIQLYNNRAATFNELRKAAGLNSVEGGDMWGAEPPLENTRIDIKKDKAEQPIKESKSKKRLREALEKSAYVPIQQEKIKVQLPKKDQGNKKENLKKSVKNFMK